MTKRLFPALILILALFFCSCERADSVPPSQAFPDQTTTTSTTSTTTTTSTAGTTQTTQTTAPAHSDIYLPEYSVDQIQEYFNEVVLNMEYSDGTGDVTLVQKWTSPIVYRIYGTPTEEDLTILNELFAQLNEISGFPGIYEAEEGEYENLNISFIDADSFRMSFSEILNGEDAYGGTQFWYYTDSNEIYTANIGYRTDLDQTTRSSILPEEIVNMLGLSDTVLRPDSIVYQYSNDNFVLSDIDWVILKLLYSPEIQCGMNNDSCSAVIKELYY